MSSTHTLPRAARPARRLRRILPVVVLPALALAGCSDSTSSGKPATYYGDRVTVGDGSARSWITVNADGAPLALGLALDDSALAGLPTDSTAMPEWVVPLPAQAIAATPFKEIGLDWNPVGHPPQGVYTVPHFDVHFYMIDEAGRDQITPADSQFAEKGAKAPAADLIPTDYMAVPGTVPRMGTHWVDSTAAELHGSPFTKTFIYGFYDAHMIFVEPMVTMAYLQSKPDSALAPVKTPARYETAGNYPSSYGVWYDATAHEYHVALGGFAHRD